MDLIIILERTSTHPTTIRYVLRATVPTPRQSFYADPEKTSFYSGWNGTSWSTGGVN